MFKVCLKTISFCVDHFAISTLYVLKLNRKLFPSFLLVFLLLQIVVFDFCVKRREIEKNFFAR